MGYYDSTESCTRVHRKELYCEVCLKWIFTYVSIFLNLTIRSRHIRNNLSPEVLKLAERYMCDTRGDLWGFLKEVDETMKRYSKNIEESQNRYVQDLCFE